MNTKRKIQLGALAVIVSGPMALGLLAPLPAMATTCNPLNTCIPTGLCPGNGYAQGYCVTHAPAGCKFLQFTCVPDTQCGGTQLNCAYVPQ